MTQLEEVVSEDFVVVNPENIDGMFDTDLFDVIRKNVIKNSNYVSAEDKEEIIQRVMIRLYKSLKSKLRRYNAEDNKPKVVMETKKFYSFVKRFCINEIIQWWRKSKKENSKRVTFHEDLDYSKPMIELIESLKFKGQNGVNEVESNFCPKCSSIVYTDLCPKCGHNIVPYILNITNLRNDTVSEFKIGEDALNLRIMAEQLRKFFSIAEVKILVMLAQNMTQKDIYEEIFKDKYKNPSIVHKKIRKIKRKISNNILIKNYLIINLGV